MIHPSNRLNFQKSTDTFLSLGAVWKQIFSSFVIDAGFFGKKKQDLSN